jgi:hypothetical protein
MRASLLALAAGVQLGIGWLPPGLPNDPGRRTLAIRDTTLALPDSVQALLSMVVDLRVAPDLSFYLSDRQLPFVLHLDRTGRLIRTLGRAGSGPGEFQRPAMMGWRGDSLWVYDMGLGRVTLFDTASTTGHATVSLLYPTRPVGTGRRPYVGGSLFPLALLPEGQLLVNRSPRPEDSGPPEARVLLLTRELEVLDTLAELPAGHTSMAFIFRDGAIHMIQPFHDDPLVSVSPDGRWLVRIDRPATTGPGPGVFTVALMEPGGQLAYRREWRYDPLPVSDDTVEAFIQGSVAFASNPGQGQTRLPLTRDSLKRKLYRPRYFPPVSNVRVGRDGTVWLRLMDASARDLIRRGQVQWVALSPRGFEVRRVGLPSRLLVHDVDRHSIWGAEYDPDGVPYVRRFVVE